MKRLGSISDLFRWSTCVNSANFGISTYWSLESVDPVLWGTGCFNEIECKQNVLGSWTTRNTNRPIFTYLNRAIITQAYNYSTYNQILKYVQSSYMNKWVFMQTLPCTRKVQNHKQGSWPQKGIVGRVDRWGLGACVHCVCVFVWGSCSQAVCIGKCVQLPDIVCANGGPEWWALVHRALGMMVNGRMGLLASSSRAVMKHSVAAAVFPWACRTSPRLFHTSWAVLRTGEDELRHSLPNITKTYLFG